MNAPRPKDLVDPSVTTLAHFLPGRLYKVPDYQRPFSWTKNQIESFWVDLQRVAETKLANNVDRAHAIEQHFMGALVLEGEDNVAEFDIMDGQQRLITTSVLAAILHEAAGMMKDTDQKQDMQYSLQSILYEVGDGSRRARIELGHPKENEHFHEMFVKVQTEAGRQTYLTSLSEDVRRREVISRLEDANVYLKEAVSSFVGPDSESGYDDKVRSLVYGMTELLVFIRLRVTAKDNAYQIFQSLNATALALHQADLIKNKLLELAQQQGGEAAKDEVRDTWIRAYDAFSDPDLPISLTEFILYHFLSIGGEAKEEKLFDEVSNWFSSSPSATSIKDYVSELAKRAESISSLLVNPPTVLEKDVKAIRHYLNNKYSIILLIAGLSKHDVGSMDFQKVATLAHHFAFRTLNVIQRTNSKYQAEVVQLAKTYVGRTRSDPAWLAAEMKSLCPDPEFEAWFEEWKAGTNKIGFYAIKQIEEYLAVGAGIKVIDQGAAQHLEHIMPKTPDSEWSHVEVDDHAFAEHLNRLGNLLILERDINAYIRNEAYEFKRGDAGVNDDPGRAYRHSAMRLPRMLDPYLESGRWTYGSIETRQQHLARNYANAVWDLTG